MQAVADPLHDHLIAANVGLSFFPGDELGNGLGQAVDFGRAERRPVSVVDQQAELGAFANRAVVVQQALEMGVGIVGREAKDAVGACRLRLLRQLDRELMPETGSRDHRHFSVDFLDRCLDHLVVFLSGKRIHLARSAGCHYGAQRELCHLGDVRPQTVDVEREIRFERRHRKGDDAGKFTAKFTGFHGFFRAPNASEG